MIERDPTAWSLATWTLALGMAVLGGLVNWWTRVKQGSARALNVIELIGEIVTSGFVGLGVFMLLDALDQPIGICAAASGVGGHMATRLLFLAERNLEVWLSRFVGSTHGQPIAAREDYAPGPIESDSRISPAPQHRDGGI